MGSSKQASKDLKVQIIHSLKAGKDYLKISECFHIASSAIRNIFKELKLHAKVEVKARFGRPRKPMLEKSEN